MKMKMLMLFLCVSANCLNAMELPEDPIDRLIGSAIIINVFNLEPNRECIDGLVQQGLVTSENIDSERPNARGTNRTALSTAIRTAYGFKVCENFSNLLPGDTMDSTIIEKLIRYGANPLRCDEATQSCEAFVPALRFRRDHLIHTSYHPILRALNDLRARCRVMAEGRKSQDPIHAGFITFPNEMLVHMAEHGSGVAEVERHILQVTKK